MGQVQDKDHPAGGRKGIGGSQNPPEAYRYLGPETVAEMMSENEARNLSGRQVIDGDGREYTLTDQSVRVYDYICYTTECGLQVYIPIVAVRYKVETALVPNRIVRVL